MPTRCPHKHRHGFSLPADVLDLMQRVYERYPRIAAYRAPKSVLAELALTVYCQAALEHGLDGDWMPLSPTGQAPNRPPSAERARVRQTAPRRMAFPTSRLPVQRGSAWILLTLDGRIVCWESPDIGEVLGVVPSEGQVHLRELLRDELGRPVAAAIGVVVAGGQPCALTSLSGALLVTICRGEEGYLEVYVRLRNAGGSPRDD